MKICVLIRTLNEAHRIKKCCEAYQFADHILIADGGSSDKTVELALSFPKVSVKTFTSKVTLKNGFWRNPDGPHLNFLYEWGIAEGADWIISQDCDQRPNKYLKQDVRSILEKTDKDFLMVTQIFLWGKDYYFPKMSRSSVWWQGLWAWRASANIRAIDHMPHYEFTVDGVKAYDFDKSNRTERILPPYCFMHFGWETDEMVDKQVEYYRRSGLVPETRHPLDYCGRLAEIEDWMIE